MHILHDPFCRGRRGKFCVFKAITSCNLKEQGLQHCLHEEQLPGRKALIAIGGTSVKKYGYDFFAERKAAEENMIKMAKAMGVENAASGKDFIKALDDLITAVGCADLKMSDEGITYEELDKYPAKLHEVLGGDITADPLPLSDDDYLTIYRNAWK